jgi:preprotein translocase subunit SecE
MAQATTAPKPNIIMRFVQYLRDVRRELKRVVWPTRNEVINSSLVVMVTLAFFVLFTFVVDSISVYVIGLISRIGG